MKKFVKLFTNLRLTELPFNDFYPYIVEFVQKLGFTLQLVNRRSVYCISGNISLLIFNSFASEFYHWVMNRIPAYNIYNFLIFLGATHRFFSLRLIVKKISHLNYCPFVTCARSWTIFSFN